VDKYFHRSDATFSFLPPILHAPFYNTFRHQNGHPCCVILTRITQQGTHCRKKTCRTQLTMLAADNQQVSAFYRFYRIFIENVPQATKLMWQCNNFSKITTPEDGRVSSKRVVEECTEDRRQEQNRCIWKVKIPIHWRLIAMKQDAEIQYYEPRNDCAGEGKKQFNGLTDWADE
jgi:hypothetical protein